MFLKICFKVYYVFYLSTVTGKHAEDAADGRRGESFDGQKLLVVVVGFSPAKGRIVKKRLLYILHLRPKYYKTFFVILLKCI